MKKKFLSYILIFCALSTFLVGCSQKEDNTSSADKENLIETNTQLNNAMDTINNMKGSDFANIKIDKESATKINLNSSTIDVEGSGVTVQENIVTITAKGNYYMTGTLEDGQIIVDASEKDVVLVFDNVNIKSKTSSPIYIKEAKNTVVYLQDDSENFIEDSNDYVLVGDETEPDAAIFSKSDLYIVGNGSLNVKANYNDAIKSKDDFSVLGGTVNVESVDDGIVGKDSVSLRSCNVNVNVSGDGIKSTNAEDVTKGYIAIKDGNFDIVSLGDGIQAETDINIAGGNFKIVTGGGSVVGSANNNFDAGMRMWGEWDKTSDDESSQSAKGIKATNNLNIMGGDFNIDSSDDAIHSNNNIMISAGNILILSGDDGIHADNILNILDGNISIEKSYEGLEASTIEIENGKIKIVASDDGINVAGGNDGSSISGRPGQNKFSFSENCILNISGGEILINAMGDGLDANGSIYLSGGNVEVAGPTNSGNGALDYAKECVVTGGNLIAYGSLGMSQTPSSNSTQNVISVAGNYNENDKIEIRLDDKSIYTCILKKNCQHVVISSDKIETGKTYSLFVNDAEAEYFEIASVITNVGERNNMGGMFDGKGGMPGKFDEGRGHMKDIPSGEIPNFEEFKPEDMRSRGKEIMSGDFLNNIEKGTRNFEKR